jgi:hypothetical protein
MVKVPLERVQRLVLISVGTIDFMRLAAQKRVLPCCTKSGAREQEKQTNMNESNAHTSITTKIERQSQKIRRVKG